MPIRTAPPPMPTRATANKIAKKVDARHTMTVFQEVVSVLLIAHFVLVLAILRRGIAGYLLSWIAAYRYIVAHPFATPIIPVALALIYKGIDLWRHSEPGSVPLPEFDAIPDLRFTNDVYIGSGHTRDGKQPGETWDPTIDNEDDLFHGVTQHVILKETGLFGNIHVKGGVGSGKSSSLILPFVDQAISKFPKPQHPDAFPLGPDGRFRAAAGVRNARTLSRLASRLGLRPATTPTPAATTETWNPYVGMTRDQAIAEYERLMELHRNQKWGIFLIDAKGDLTDAITRMAAVADRLDDVVVLAPESQYTYNPLLVNADPLVQSEMVMDGIEAVAGQQINQYYRQTMSEWLANALTILRVVDPTRITFKNILRMARSENLRTAMVAEAEAIMRQAQEEEERLARLGKPYTGVRVNSAAIEFFRDWDDVDSDPRRKQEIVSAIKAQAKFFVGDALAPWLCPEMPPTFRGFEEMIDKGQIVILRMPLDQWGPVAKVLGILVIADAQQAARARINKPGMNQARVVAMVIDEIQNYLNRLTKEFISMNRQSRVCFLGAHQSQGQLVQHGDRGFETSFNDNLRTKVSYASPNADAGRRESAIFGSRKVWKERYSENQSFQKVQPLPESEAFAAEGGQSQGASLSLEEVERPWFAADDFVALRTAECIVLEFDGEGTLPPRKIKAPQFHKTSRYALTNAAQVPPVAMKPHPVVFIRDTGDAPDSRDHEYLNAALVQTGYVICEPLANVGGELQGFKFVTDVGTLVVSCDMLERLRDVIGERLTDPQTLVVFTDFVNCAGYFAAPESLGLTFERIIGLLDIYRDVFPEATEQSLAGLFERETGRPLSYNPADGAWEYHVDVAAHGSAIQQDSRDIVRLFARLGEELHKRGHDQLEDLYEAERQRIQDVLTAPPTPEPPAPGPSAPATEAVTEPTTAHAPGDPTALGDMPAFDADADDPFSADAYPEVLSNAPNAAPVTAPPTAPTPAEANPTGTAAPTSPYTIPDVAPRRMRRARRRAPGGDQSLFDLRPSPLSGDVGLDDEDASGGPAALPSGNASSPTTSSHDSASIGSGTASDDASATQPRRQARRRNAGPGRRARSTRPNVPTLDLGLPEDGAATRAPRAPGAGDDDDAADVVSGPPLP